MLKRTVLNDRKKSSRQVAAELREGNVANVSSRTVRWHLNKCNIRGCVARKKPYLKQCHKKARLEFAKKYIKEPETFFNKVLWSDETKINLFNSDGRQFVWRFKNEEFKEDCLVPTGSIVVVVCYFERLHEYKRSWRP